MPELKVLYLRFQESVLYFQVICLSNLEKLKYNAIYHYTIIENMVKTKLCINKKLQINKDVCAVLGIETDQWTCGEIEWNNPEVRQTNVFESAVLNPGPRDLQLCIVCISLLFNAPGSNHQLIRRALHELFRLRWSQDSVHSSLILAHRKSADV